MPHHGFLATVALATLAALGTASAADLPMPAPVYKAPSAPVYNWTVCYGGGGDGMWNQDSFVTANGTAVTSSNTNGGKGWFGQG
jgi:hypothetical protein